MRFERSCAGSVTVENRQDNVLEHIVGDCMGASAKRRAKVGTAIVRTCSPLGLVSTRSSDPVTPIGVATAERLLRDISEQPQGRNDGLIVSLLHAASTSQVGTPT